MAEPVASSASPERPAEQPALVPPPTVVVKPAPDQTHEVTTIKTEQLPRPFWQGVVEDVHVNASGLVFFSCMAAGVIWPEYADKCTKIATYAGIYLFGAAKNKVQP